MSDGLLYLVKRATCIISVMCNISHQAKWCGRWDSAAPDSAQFLNSCSPEGVNWLAGPSSMKIIICATQSALHCASQSHLKHFASHHVGSMDSVVKVADMRDEWS